MSPLTHEKVITADAAQELVVLASHERSAEQIDGVLTHLQQKHRSSLLAICRHFGIAVDPQTFILDDVKGAIRQYYLHGASLVHRGKLWNLLGRVRHGKSVLAPRQEEWS